MCENDMFPKVRQRGSPVAALAEGCTWHGTFSGSLIALVGCVPGSGGLLSRHGTCRISLRLWTANCNSLPWPLHTSICNIWKRVDYCVPVSGTGGAREGAHG